MKQYRFKTTIIVAMSICCAVLFASCTGNFEELNTHPTNPDPTKDMTEAERVGTLIPSMLYLMHNFQENQNQMIEQMVGGQYGGYFATTNNWQGTNFGTFNPPANWVEYPFNTLFTKFYSNYLTIKEVTEGKGYVFSWVNIIRVAVMLRVTDTYGPIPYSKMGGGQFAVEYDSVEDIYHKMIDDLDESINALTVFLEENKGKKIPIAEFDLIYDGDFSKWVRFANSLKFRMAVRIANVDTDYAKVVMTKAIAAGVIESNGDNAFLPTTDNPYYKASNDWGDLAMNAMMSAYMNGYNDPRRSVYMLKTADDVYRGVRIGIPNINKGIYGTAQYSKPAFKKDSPLLVYCAAETFFLKAEAALQGWIPGGTSQSKIYYEQGITTSMEQHGVAIGTYLAGTTSATRYNDPNGNVNAPSFSSITVSWDNGSASTTMKLEKIITQKWLANYPLGFEAWADHRRTGYPQMITAQSNLSSANSIGSITNSKTRLVRRLPYPVSEYSGNTQNVEAAVANLLGGADTGATDLWWARKN
ncbi:SusD/RagB family nutrient-binding outer membrane lipoprotein [Bacteroides sp.]|uniref:SusD/RagB family nutrient-binding outer membrane lipoprotein n=1 Tax=Bacteroides sp. TaxID=29523 RepID=UPI0025C5A4F6|nr:SusD/RagB family nutrient-binding outer membrane lipoprotein [Bacteroides sp.]